MLQVGELGGCHACPVMEKYGRRLVWLVEPSLQSANDPSNLKFLGD